MDQLAAKQATDPRGGLSSTLIGLRLAALSLAGVGVAALFVACGGGGGGTGGTTPPVVSPPPTSETINGIVVPPAPDATTNATTIKGIDRNNNGVRDDVERVLAGVSKKSTYEGGTTLEIARLLNRLATEEFATPEAVLEIEQRIYCLDQRRTSSERATLDVEIVRRLTNSTDGRVSVWRKNEQLSASVASRFEEGLACN